MATFQDLIDLARVPLNDADKERYPDAKLLGYAKDGLREAAVLRPDLFAATGQVNCVAGVEQQIPEGGWFIITVLTNSVGEDVLEADYQTYRAFNPGWRTDDAGPADIWMRYDEKGPNNRFFVYPPAVMGAQIDVEYVVCNVAELELDDDVPLDEPYLPGLQDYVTGRAEEVDDQHTVSQRQAQLIQAFAARLGVGAKTEEVKP